jgi:SNF2 family DNA or RNA helicase
MTFPVAERSAAIDAKLAADSQAHLHRLKNPPTFSAPSFREHARTGRHKDGTPFTLYPHQLVSISNGLRDPRHMVNLGMGLGKTAIGWAMACKLRPKRMAIITTYGGKAVWEDEMAEWTHIRPDRLQVVDGTAAKRRDQIGQFMEADPNEARILAFNWDLLRLHPEMADVVFDFMVVDEFHRAKNHEAAVTEAFLKLRAHRELLLSGTPMINRTEELWTPLHRVCRRRDSLRPTDTNSKYPSSWLFNKTLRIKFGGSDSLLGRNPDFMEMIKQDLDDHSTRFRRDQVDQDLPEVIPFTVKVRLTSEQRKLYNKIRDEFKLELEDGRTHTVSDARALITRLKQACWSPELYGGSQKSAKVDELRGIVRDLVDAGEKAILFSQWSKATRILQREFGHYGIAYVDGGINAAKRKLEAKRFNTDPDCKLYIGTIGANRESITLGAATNVVFTDKEWSDEYNDQARDRSASGGLRGLGVSHVNLIELLAEDTVDFDIEAVLGRKSNEFDVVVESDGGNRAKKKRRHPLTFDELMAAI